MTTTIIFDLSEVYLQGLLGLGRELVESKLEGPPLTSLFKGEITEDEYWSKAEAPHLKQPLRENFTEIPGTREIIESLKKQGFKLGLLSTHAREWIDYCEQKYNYHKLFDTVSYSFETGFLKPDPRAFQVVLKKLDSKPEECIFIDDDPRNTEAAEELGIKSMVFKDSEQLKNDLFLLLPTQP